MVDLLPLTPALLPELERVLGDPAFGGCFCAMWKHIGPDWRARCADPTRPNLHATRADVQQGRRAGYLIRFEGVVVGWTGSGPRTEFPAAATRLGSRKGTPDGWVVGCFALLPEHRGKGIAGAALDALLALAEADGAPCIEATPVRPWDEPRAYRGQEALFTTRGFEEVLSESDGTSDILLLRKQLV